MDCSWKEPKGNPKIEIHKNISEQQAYCCHVKFLPVTYVCLTYLLLSTSNLIRRGGLIVTPRCITLFRLSLLGRPNKPRYSLFHSLKCYSLMSQNDNLFFLWDIRLLYVFMDNFFLNFT